MKFYRTEHGCKDKYTRVIIHNSDFYLASNWCYTHLQTDKWFFDSNLDVGERLRIDLHGNLQIGGGDRAIYFTDEDDAIVFKLAFGK